MSAALTAYAAAITVAAYLLSRVLAKRWRSPFTTPVFFSTAVIMIVLIASDLRVEDYEPAKDILTFLLGPATVALAVPLYKNRRILTANWLPALSGLVVGTIATILTAIVLAKIFIFPNPIAASLTIKSVTAPIAIQLADLIQGNPTLVAAFVILTGMIGAMFGPWLMSLARIQDPLARGFALGTISHGQGAAQALLESELAGAAAGIAIALSAVATSLLAPLLVKALF
jgi:predicted murein hydrolase (TIGR00659 family)